MKNIYIYMYVWMRCREKKRNFQLDNLVVNITKRLNVIILNVLQIRETRTSHAMQP